MKKCSFTTGKFARRDKKGAVKQWQQEGAADQLSNSPMSPGRSVVAVVHNLHSSSFCLLATSLEHEMKADLHMGMPYPCSRGAGGTSTLCSHGASGQLCGRQHWWRSWGSGGVRAGDEGIPMGLICVRWLPHTTAMFAIAELAILKLAQACL